QLFDMVESIDSVRVAAAVSRRLEEPLPVLLEVNLAGEESKSGFAPDEVAAALAEIRALPQLDVRGLMTIAPLVVDPEEARPHFRGLRQLGETLGLAALSMGMTNDYRVAIEEGATIVRIGRAIFGDR
ncbi:MAG: alanine racemase, partial [Chloroflexi bacterium]|nr:alanine racemase [Chloroflexota bacterium]